MNYNILMYISRILAFATAIPFHETAHAYVSNKLGDPTAKNLGRLTLNPIKHIDVMGLLAMLVIGVGWAKPVPIDPRYYKDRKKGMALTAAAGPLSNLILAYVFVLIQKIYIYTIIVFKPEWFYPGVTTPVVIESIRVVLYFMALININLAIFNLIPIPPFDGSRILGLVLPEKIYFGIQKYERYMMFGILAVIFILPRFFGVDPIGWLLNTAGGHVLNFLDKATIYIDWLFGKKVKLF